MTRIDGIVSCVGPLYTSYFKNALPIWLDTLDSLTVVTQPGDPVLDLPLGRAHVVTTTAFTDYGAYFNKGAGLNLAYWWADPKDWVLHIDADIVPPDSWRRALPELDFRCIYGAHRVSRRGVRSFHTGIKPYGYFQLWHSDALGALRWPIFDTWHSHAGAYDVEFLERWPREYWSRINSVLVHQGKQRTNWFGVGNEHMMDMVRNPKKYRIASQQGIGILDIPQPKLRYRLDPCIGLDTIRGILRAAGARGLYDVRVVTCLHSLDGFEDVDGKIPEKFCKIGLDKRTAPA